jgi:cyclic pyranopterin phosphate synthase
MPEEGMTWLRKEKLLSYEEITRVASIASSLGVHKVSLTGGEPLMRKELWKLVGMLRSLPGIDDIALTTNGYFLKDQVRNLVEAGLSRINISLDSLDPAVFAGVARRESFKRTWEGIEAADRHGVRPLKLNVVLIRGVNDREILEFARLARERDFVVRFIEFMPIGKDDEWSIEKVVPAKEVIDTINSFARLVPVIKDGQRSPADRFVFEDGKGEIGVISSVSQPFCADCDRVRLTSDGKLRTCLFSLHETDLRALLRSGESDETIAASMRDAVWKKEEGHLINRPGFVRPDRTMSQIGG